MNYLPNTVPPGRKAGRRRTETAVAVARVRLLADLALALVERGRSSRMLVEAGGEAVLTVPTGGEPIGVVVIRDQAGWAYLWGGTQRYPAGVGLPGLRRAAAALTGCGR
ncbi:MULTISPECIES: hypothetical protein [Thermomonospora]|uniref:Uncharacterized protein n=1 Tax=Thermomonospora curvata (strain ATCC 19995 / DSM 43183 / JCM 3096 / KCTC 9072 / NBRC 15933 / NCIMB 10081 / Henssen B9) TaxID=471852 RepID=D1ACA6_THECD|nr:MULTISPECIES: hypothetical protein [Thermomonospora]ACY99165.1 hypothetical protein Tcur_3631 [Thermomonospora curvata DSM 43183]